MKSCIVGLLVEALFPAFILEIMLVLWFFHWCFLIAFRKLAFALFLDDAWLLITRPHSEQVPFMVGSLLVDVEDEHDLSTLIGVAGEDV